MSAFSGIEGNRKPAPLASSKPKGRPRRRPKELESRLVSKPQPNVLKCRLKASDTAEAREAEYMVEGLAMNALTGLAFSSKLTTLDLTECFEQIVRNAQTTATGDRKSQESILAAQVISMNAIYTELALLARTNLTHSFSLFERLMRLALKAQSNCRATAEALAVMQTPPTVFARQANFAHGPQQVNNGTLQSEPLARAMNSDSLPNKLLEANDERMDTGTAGASVNRDQAMATVGALDGTKDARR
jgi:hypothetical protein